MERVVLVWRHASLVSQWPPSSFAVDGGSYSCAAQQYMMAEKARLFQGHDVAERVMASPDPGEHKRLDRGVQNVDCTIWDRVREDSVLAGTFAKPTQNPTVKQHLLRTGTNGLAEASPFDPV